MSKLRQHLGWLCCCACVFAGLLIYFAAPFCRFSAMLAFGAAGVFACYQLLQLSKKRHPKLRRVLFAILTVCLFVGMVAAVITGILIGKAAGGDTVAACDYIIVLGAGVDGTVPSLSLQERLDAAYNYLIAHPNAVCVVSGGQGSGELITEAQCMYNTLTAMGINGSRILQEDKATNTRENIAFSLALIEARTGSRPNAIGIVSSEYHLYRADLFAREQGLTSVGIPAKTTMFGLRVNYFLREIAAVWYYWVF